MQLRFGGFFITLYWLVKLAKLARWLVITVGPLVRGEVITVGSLACGSVIFLLMMFDEIDVYPRQPFSIFP